jgi:hypothetical protein
MLRKLLIPYLMASGLLASAAHAQVCSSGNLLKNDGLPDNPTGSVSVSIIPGLCEGEAAGAVFSLPPGGTPQRLSKVAVGFGSANGASGAVAIVNVEIYDGVSFNGAVATLGPKVFDLNQASGGNTQVTSTGVNEIDISPYDVVVGNAGDDDYVVAFRMDFNPNGNCASGYPTNFFTDNDQPGFFGCDPTITPAGKNLIDIQGQGWRDAALATVTGIPLCPLYYSGNWVIRACSEDAGPVNPLNVTITGGTAIPGGFLNLSFNASGYAGVPYVAAAALGDAPGFPVASGNPVVIQTVPLNLDPLFISSLSAPGTFINFAGVIGASGNAPGILALPNSPSISGLQLYVAFLTLTPPPAPYGVSSATKIQVL